MTEFAHNPQGIGWKKHGKSGRFVKRRYTADKCISFLIGVAVTGTIFILFWNWLVLYTAKVQPIMTPLP